jgi:predicted phosphate transport protein (TIGR00153 family)
VRFLPREEKFFDLFIEAARRSNEAASYLKELFTGKTERWIYCIQSIKRLEHEADQIAREVSTRLNRTFITPIDPEDIHLLASDLDNVIDGIDGTARRVQIFKLTEPARPGVDDMCDVIQRITATILQAVTHLRDDREAVIGCSIEAKKLEEEGDAVYQGILGRLFEEEHDPVRLIKWKEIYDTLETTVDKAEDVANDLESIAIKNA